jgi:alpha-L-rhamnosidase
MRDTYMDCPDRERSLWWGDAVNELGESFYALDRRSDLLTRKCILNLIGWQRPDGVLFSPVPAGNWDKDLPLQMLASIGHKGFWSYGLYSGDMATLRDVYPGVKRYLEIWQMQADGLVVPRRGSWEWGDWGSNVDLTLLYNEWYYLALQGMREMAVALQHPEDLAWIDARLSSIEKAFNPAFWNGKEYRSPDFKGQTDDRANALAVVAGLAKPVQYPALIEVLKTQEHASPYMEKYVLEALCLMNQPALAQDRMHRRYQRMVDYAGLSTLWEGWGIGSDGFGGGSVNHAWSGGPLTIMSQYFAGIAPLTPGFATYEVRPQLGHLTKVTAGVDTVKGRIEVSISRSEGGFNLKLVSPQNTSGRVCIPVAESNLKTIRVNGKRVWSDGQPTGHIKGLTPADEVAGHAFFIVTPGVWKFECR